MRINNKSQTKGLVLHDLREATLVVEDAKTNSQEARNERGHFSSISS